MNFELTLAEERVKRHQVTALHLIVAVTLCFTGGFCFLLHKYSSSWNASLQQAAAFLGWGFLGLGVALLVFSVARGKVVARPSVTRMLRIAELVLMAALAIGAVLKQWYVPAGIYGLLSAVLVFAMYMEATAHILPIIFVSEAGIKLPVTTRKRFIYWNEVDKVLLRHGVLTVDCYDNHLYQWNIQGYKFDSAVFEQYCSVQAAANKEKRVADW